MKLGSRWQTGGAFWRGALGAPFLLFASCVVNAQPVEQLRFSIFPMPNGAPVAEVSGIVEDRDGAIWVATWGEGVHRIHGTEWTTYTEKDGLPDDWVRTMAPASSGGVWAATGEGLARITRDGVEVPGAEIPPALAGADIFFVHQFADGAVWASTGDGQVFERHSTSENLARDWRLIAGPETTGGQPVYQAIPTDDGATLVSIANEGLRWVRDGEWTAVPLASPGRWFTLFSGTVGGESAVWAASRDNRGLFRWDGNTWSAQEPAPAQIFRMAATDSGDVLAATLRGLHRWDGSAWRVYPLPGDLGSPALEHVFVSSDGTVWLGSREGIYRGAKRPWHRIAISGEPCGIIPRRDTKDPVVALNRRGEVFRWSDGAWKLRNRLPGWLGGHWRAADTIWLGDGQLWESDGERLQWIYVAGNELHRVHKERYSVLSLENWGPIRESQLPPLDGYRGRFLPTWDGQLLAITDQAVFSLSNGQWQAYPAFPAYEPKHTYIIRETEPGVFWAGVDPGLERWADGTVTSYGPESGFDSEDSVHAILQTTTGEIWFGTMGSGLFRFDGERFHQVSKEEGLFSNAVRNVYEVSDGTLWVTYRGAGASAYRNGRWVHYTHEQGLPNAAILGIAETEPGLLSGFASNGRMLRYRPELLAPETHIEVAPNEVDAHGVAVFSFSGRDAWNDTERRDLLYSWRILPGSGGQDNGGGWSRFSRSTTVASGALDRGRYRFEVRASDDNGNIDPTPAFQAFAVSPPLWLKPVLYVPVSLSLVLALIALGFRHRSHQALLRSEIALREEVEVRKHAEAELASHRDNLEDLVEERTKDLEDAQVALLRKERLATLGQLTATVSHELRNPLGTLQSSLFVLKRRIGDEDSEHRATLERMERSIRRCDHIVEEMLDYTRQHALTPCKEDLDAWIASTVQDLGVPEGVELAFALESRATVRIDAEHLRRVLINLLDNSLQAMANGGKPATGRIRLSSWRGEHRAMVRFHDSGPGISDDAIEHIFEPLYSTKNFGVGLGTNIIKSVLERHGGDIAYVQTPEGGACAEFWLPAEYENEDQA